MKKLIILLVVIAAGVGGVFYFRRQAAADSVSYLYVAVTRGDVESTVSATGNLSAVDSVQVGTQVSGIIDVLNADFNDHVHKGELIARLDTTVLRLAYDRAVASEDQGKADLVQKGYALEQVKRLLATGAETESDYETALANDVMSKATLASDSVALREARQNLDYAYIYSPINGIVIKRAVDVGQTVASSFSAPELFLIAGDLSQMQIVASVDESDIGQIHDGQTVAFTVEAYPDRTFSGVVRQVRMQSTTVDNVVDYPVVVDVENKDGALRPGMTATVNFEVAKSANVLKVPDAALRFQPTAAMVAQIRAQRAASGADTSRGGAKGDSASRSGRGGFGRRGGAAGGRGGFGAAGGGRGGRGGATANGGRPVGDVATLWYMKDGKLAATRVHTGLSDGQETEISGPNVVEGMQIIAAVTSGASSAATKAPTNPFQSNNQNGRGRGGPGGGRGF